MINKVILLGRLGSDPQVRHLDSNRSVCNLNLATNEHFKTADGSVKEITEWHRLELWDGLAKLAEKNLRKGSLVYVEGKIRTEKYTDQQGVEKENKRIRVSSLQVISGRNNVENLENNANPVQKLANSTDEVNDLLSGNDDSGDLPF